MGSLPDLRGTRVIILPVQQVLGVPGDPDAEIAFGLRDRTQEVTWIFPQEVDEALARAPAVNGRPFGPDVAVVRGSMTTG